MESKLTKATAKAITDAVARGLPLKFAAASADIGERTLYRWLKAGKTAGTGPEWQLWQELKKAQAKSVAVRVARLSKAATKGAWQADCWWLERVFPGQFASDRRELAALRKELAELRREVLGGRGDPDAPRGAAAEEGRPAD